MSAIVRLILRGTPHGLAAAYLRLVRPSSIVGAIVFSFLFAAAIGAAIVQFPSYRRHSFSWRAAAVSGFVALVLVVMVATPIAYFLARVRIGDHYEVNSVLMAIFVVGPAAAGVIAGAAMGAFIARYARAMDR